jgi:hypothetical protein
MLDHYLLTGDPDSLEAARGLAERLLALPAWDRCARHVGWPLAQITRWYDHARDPRFLRKSRELLRAAKAYVEPRRGVFAEMHGCWNYRGSVPFMTGYLAYGLVRYHEATADPDALALLRALLDGLVAESSPSPGRFIYSPFPENNGVTPIASPSSDVAGLAGYLLLTTGDEGCGRIARECYEALFGDDGRAQVALDHMTLAGWMLKAVAALPESRGGNGGAGQRLVRQRKGPAAAQSPGRR